MLTKNEMENFLGGGYWLSLSDGRWVYVDGDEEDDGADFFFG